jgi:hypothetical protein
VVDGAGATSIEVLEGVGITGAGTEVVEATETEVEVVEALGALEWKNWCPCLLSLVVVVETVVSSALAQTVIVTGTVTMSVSISVTQTTSRLLRGAALAMAPKSAEAAMIPKDFILIMMLREA